MKKLIKKFLEEQELSKGQLYKIAPDKLLKEFRKFAKKQNYKLKKNKSCLQKKESLPN